MVVSEEEGRRTILLKNVRYRGSTTANWREFANGRQNPVRYL